MRIAILGLTATSYGSLTYLKNLLPHLAQLDRDNQYEIFLPASTAHEWKLPPANFRVRVPRSAPTAGTWRVLWEQLVFPWIAHAHGVDAIYTTHSTAILCASAPSLIIIQNVEPFFAGQFPNPLPFRIRLWLLRKLTELSLRHSRGIIAISDWEKEFLVARLGVPAARIVVSYPGVTEGFHPAAPGSAALLRQHLGIEPPYLLAVTRLAGYGNFLNLAKAYALLVKEGKVSMPLVIPGEVWDRQYIDGAQKLLAAEGCADKVKFLGYVPHQYMPLLFGHAECFVFPSLLEACGTVLIEALACGTPILCCGRRPMSDIGGDAAVLFNGEDFRDMADKIAEVLSNAGLRQTLSQRAVERARQFSWQEGAKKVHRLLQQLAPAADQARQEAQATPPERSA